MVDESRLRAIYTQRQDSQGWSKLRITRVLPSPDSIGLL